MHVKFLKYFILLTWNEMFNFSWPLAELASLSPFAAHWEQQNHVPPWPGLSSPSLRLAQTHKNLVWSEANDFLIENLTDIDFSFTERLELKENPFSTENGFERQPKIIRFLPLRKGILFFHHD